MEKSTKPFVISRETYAQILMLILKDQRSRSKARRKIRQEDIYDTIDLEVHVVVVNDGINRRL